MGCYSTGSRDHSTDKQQTEEVKELLDNWETAEKCSALYFDTSAFNTKRFCDSILLLEAQLGLPLLWIAWLHHMFEVILFHAFKCLFADSTGSHGAVVSTTKNNWHPTDLTKATSHLKSSILT